MVIATSQKQARVVHQQQSLFTNLTVAENISLADLPTRAGPGFRTVDGLSMLIGQADHAFRRFFGAVPPRGQADAELRARILA